VGEAVGQAQNRSRKVVSFTISPKADARITTLARRLKVSRSVVLELLVGGWGVGEFREPALRAEAKKLTADNKDRRYASRKGWALRRERRQPTVVGSPGDTGCYARSGKACEGFASHGCRHCGRIIGARANP